MLIEMSQQYTNNIVLEKYLFVICMFIYIISIGSGYNIRVTCLFTFQLISLWNLSKKTKTKLKPGQVSYEL